MSVMPDEPNVDVSVKNGHVVVTMPNGSRYELTALQARAWAEQMQAAVSEPGVDEVLINPDARSARARRATNDE